MAWIEPQTFGRAQRAFLVTLGNLIGAAAQRVEEVTQSELQRFVGAFDAMLDSPTGLAILTTSSFDRMGVAVVDGPTGRLVVIDLGG